MGTDVESGHHSLQHSPPNMKSILFIACLVLVQGAPAPDAEPEADPYFYYNTGLNYPTTTTYHHGGLHTAAIVPATTYHHGGLHTAAVVPSVVSPAVPAVPTTFTGAVHTPVIHQAVVKNVEVTPAEVEKEVTPLTKTFVSPYNIGFGYGNYRLPYTTGAYQYPVAPLAAAPLTTTHLATAAITPVATVNAVHDAGAPSYVANSGGALHVVNKREADPEADADADAAYHFYGYPHHYGAYRFGHHYGYNRYRAYNGYYGYPYSGYYGRW